MIARAFTTLMCLSAMFVAPASSGATSGSTDSRRLNLVCSIVGTPGPDRLTGTSGSDVLCGAGGPDILIGRGGDDVLVGGPGDDTLSGGRGSDQLLANRGADQMRGGPASDNLIGGPGDDTLDGGAAPDTVDGGTGTNECAIDSDDAAEHCGPDDELPTADQLSLSTETINVGVVDQEVTYRVHAADDTEIVGLSLNPHEDTPWFPSAGATLVEGTRSDGWWEGTLRFHAGTAPGTYAPVVRVVDHLTHIADVRFTDLNIEVVNAVPDLDQPAVTLLAPAPARKVEVAEGGAGVTVRVHITDEASGVDPDRVSVMAWAPRKSGEQTFGSGSPLFLESGDIHDGIWAGTVTIDPDAPGGRWNLGIYVQDHASNGARRARAIYWGPDEYPYHVRESYEGDNRPLPDQWGAFYAITRNRTDQVRPVVDRVQIDKTQADTRDHAVNVNFVLHATDAGIGVDGISVALIAPQAGVGPPVRAEPNATRISGNIKDGTWEGHITLPQGTPPGRYYVRATIWDIELNTVAYYSYGYPDRNFWPLDSNPTVTVVDVSP